MRPEKTLINILGAGRSGTTMLDLMLGNDESSFSLGEIHAWFRPYRRHHKRPECSCGEHECDVWKKIVPAPAKEFHANAFDKLNKRYLVDSSKNLAWVIDNNRWSKRHDIRVVNFVIYKPLTDYIHSIWKRGETVESAIYRYKLYYRRFIESGLPAYSVSFNELVAEPDKTLIGLCEITGQVYESKRKEFWRSDCHHLFGSGGVRKQVQRGESSLAQSEIQDSEFELMMERAEASLQTDPIVQKIQLHMKQIDYKSTDRGKDCGRRNIVHLRRQPGWYYALRAKAILRRWLPEKYEDS